MQLKVKGGAFLDNVTAMGNIKIATYKYGLTWTDPVDKITSTNIVSRTATRVIRKTGSYPTTMADGTTVVNETTLNQYQTSPIVDTITSSATYYYQLFPYTSAGSITNNVVNGSNVIAQTLAESSPGPTTLVSGNATAGYYGKATGIITGTDLYTATGTTGVGTSTVSGNKGVDTGDITWLKFASNGKILFVADRNIKYSMSWDQIQTANCVKGKVITISGIQYLCRLLQGADINPASAAGTVNDEWKLIVDYTPLEADSNWTSIYSLCQEVHSSGLTNRVLRGSSTVSYFAGGTSSVVTTTYGWRPCLELL